MMGSERSSDTAGQRMMREAAWSCNFGVLQGGGKNQTTGDRTFIQQHGACSACSLAAAAFDIRQHHADTQGVQQAFIRIDVQRVHYSING